MAEFQQDHALTTARSSAAALLTGLSEAAAATTTPQAELLPKTKAANVPPRERAPREKKDSLKKREAAQTTKDVGSTVPSKRKAAADESTSIHPMRYTIGPPRITDYDPPRDTQFTSHEPFPLLGPDGELELKKPVDHAENKRGYRYTHCVADPLFPRKQLYRETDTTPFGPRMSFEDADKWMHFDQTGHYITNEKGWRMARANVCAREGSLYYEVRIINGMRSSEGAAPDASAGPQPHVRMGWARREASLDAPVGFDGYSYGVTDIRFEAMHRSRSSKFFTDKDKKGSKLGRTEREYLDLQDDIRQGDVVGLQITLPNLNLHAKVVSGIYNPAVDLSTDTSTNAKLDPTAEPYDIIRDRIPVPYKGNIYFETMDYVPTRAMEAYADRTLSLSSLSSQAVAPGTPSAIKTTPNPNHPDPSLRTLPHSSIKVYKNGVYIGTAFDGLLAFLPPASSPAKAPGTREGLDDGMLGYFPAVACFAGGIAETNFGDGPGGFWFPPAHLQTNSGSAGQLGKTRAAGDRYKEQIAEDVWWDIVDEVDFFMLDGGADGMVGATGQAKASGIASLKEEAE